MRMEGKIDLTFKAGLGFNTSDSYIWMNSEEIAQNLKCSDNGKEDAEPLVLWTKNTIHKQSNSKVITAIMTVAIFVATL